MFLKFYNFSEEKNRVKLSCGWLHFSFSAKKYQQIRGSKNTNKTAGTVNTEFSLCSIYEEVVTQLTSHFFSSKHNEKGKEDDMLYTLGDAKGEENAKTNFSLEKFVQTCENQRPRLYLLTKEKVHF